MILYVYRDLNCHRKRLLQKSFIKPVAGIFVLFACQFFTTFLISASGESSPFHSGI
jgi:hypothetical protein